MASTHRTNHRLPSWISLDVEDEEGRQPSSSPPTREGKMSPRQRMSPATPPYIPQPRSRKSPTSTKRTPHRVTPSTTWEERKASRRSDRDATVPRESLLVGLCRQKDWKAALVRLQESPKEAEPLLCKNDSPFPVNLHLQNYEYNSSTLVKKEEDEISKLYQETPLHLVCSFAQFGSEGDDLPCQLLQELLRVSPQQAIVSHVYIGYTALRALLRNDTCGYKVLGLLLEATKKNFSEHFQKVCALADRDGLTPMDHIVLSFHKSSVHKPMEILKAFVENGGVGTAAPTVSPLIRLLSLGSDMARLSRSTGAAFDPSASSGTTTSPRTRVSVTSPVLAHPSQHSEQVLQATKYFVHKFPLLLDHAAQTTGCTPLHVALRNYGNYASLLRCFLLRQDEENKDDTDEDKQVLISPLVLRSLMRCNQFGDLPLHVASSVGVPVPILRLVLEGTLQATASIAPSSASANTATNLCWTVNHAGYTPIDLEWIRHMEDGKGLFMARTFYPLEAGGIKTTFWKQDEFYRVLLQQAVQQAMDMNMNVQAASANPFLRRALSSNSNNNPQPPRAIPNSTHARRTPFMSTPRRRTPRAGQVPPQQAPFRAAAANSASSPSPPPSEQPTWDLLLHRIFLITQTAARGRVPKTQTDLIHCLLHAACKLSFPQAPSLPLPLLELILFMYPEQLLQPFDSEETTEAHRNTGMAASNFETSNEGNLPLHFAVQPQLDPQGQSSMSSSSMPFSANDGGEPSTHQHTCDEWETWCKQILQHGPDASSTANNVGQLPLHKALEVHSAATVTSSTSSSSTRARKKENPTPQQQARFHVVQALVDAFPHSVNVVDPVSSLMPFQAAAIDMPLDAIFFLLRRSPDAVLV